MNLFYIHWDQTQFHHSSIPEWLLVGYHWGQKGWYFFAEKVDCFHRYPVSLLVIHLLCWLLPVLICLWLAYLHSFIIFSWYHDTCDRYLGTWTRQAWDNFAFPSSGLGPNFLSYLSSFFVYVPLLLPLLYLHVEWLCGNTFVRIWVAFHSQFFFCLHRGAFVVAH